MNTVGMPSIPMRLLLIGAVGVVATSATAAAFVMRSDISALAATPRVTLIESSYGRATVKTAAGAECALSIAVASPLTGDSPPKSLAGIAAADGSVVWMYSAPAVAATSGSHTVTCTLSGRTQVLTDVFVIQRHQPDATAFTVRLVPSGVRTKSGAEVDELAQVPLRERVIEYLRPALPRQWALATRGLSSLTMVESNADLVIRVIAGTGTSAHRTAPDGSQDVLLYVADDSGPLSLPNALSVALHEIGHTWCCSGPGTVEGHWIAQQQDPGQLGVNQFGLMNHPVVCNVLTGGDVRCPNVFSGRELRTMDFVNLPPAVIDRCDVASAALDAQLPLLDAKAAAATAELQAIDSRLAGLQSQINAIASEYARQLAEQQKAWDLIVYLNTSRGAPPPVGGPAPAPIATYRNGLIRDYNTVLAQRPAVVVAQSAALERYNAAAAERLLLSRSC